MKAYKKVLAAAAITLLPMSAMADPWASGPSSTVGTLLGGAGGAVAGAQFGKGNGKLVGVAVGTLLGAAIGNSVGTTMDRVDYSYNQPTRRYVYNDYDRPWKRPHHYNRRHYVSYEPAPVIIERPVVRQQFPVYQANNDQYCREYTNRVAVGGRSQSGYGTACYQPDGSWKIVSSDDY